MSRFGRTEKTIFTFALLMLMAFSYFLYDDSLLFPKSGPHALELIGDVNRSQNDVRRKNLDTFSWIPASSKDKIFENDSIYTGDRSDAVIRLHDGTLIRIEPNSLITLNVKNGQMKLDLRYGNLVGELAQGSSLTVSSGQEEFQLKGDDSAPEKSKIQLNKSHSGNVGLKLLAGKAQLIDKNTKKELQKNTPLAISKKGEVKQLERPTLVLKTPDNMNWVRPEPEAPIPFDWEGHGDISRYQLELSPDEAFNAISSTKNTRDQGTQVILPLPAGSYFWRLKVYNSNGQVALTSQPRRIHLTTLAPPQIITPVSEALLNLEVPVLPEAQGVVATKAQVEWRAGTELKDFTWQIATDEEFTQILQEKQTQEYGGQTPELTSGTYWVRVRGSTVNQVHTLWSQAVPFTLNLTAKVLQKPAAPILITKQIEFSAPKANERRPAAESAPRMVWKPVLATKNYHIQISKDIKFRGAQKVDSVKTQLSWSNYRPGKYYYRVFARGENGLISDPSEVGVIDISSENPVLNPIQPIVELSSKSAPHSASLTWTETPFAKSYLIEFDRTQEFSAPQKTVHPKSSGQIMLPEPGRYHARVQALDENNEPISEFSNIEEILYTARSPLAAPRLMEPFNQASIFLQTEMQPFIWLEWKKVEGASSYTLEVSDRPDFSRILVSTSQSGNRFLLKEKVPLGKIYWRVRAEDKNANELSSWAETREFVIYHQKNETFIK